MKRRSSTTILEILADLIRGGRHSRTTVARTGVSLPTADRWLKQLLKTIPGVRSAKEGKTTWFEWRAPAPAAKRPAGRARAEADRRQVTLPWETREGHVP